MTYISLDDTISVEEQLLADTRKALADAREEILNLTEMVAAKDIKSAEEAVPGIRKINSLFTVCTETENRLANARQQKAGIAQNGFAFDLDAARTEIGRKLDRLRAAAGAE